jgi:hypothetical protein
MRLTLALAVAVCLAGCESPPRQQKAAAKPDPVSEPWYEPAIARLSELNRQAAAHLSAGGSAAAAQALTEGKPLEERILSAPRPTLDAVLAASDRDNIYGRMLMADRRYGYARLEFQKDYVRWKNWKPQTADSTARRERARAAIVECDRRLME